MKGESRVSVRVAPELKQRLDEAQKVTGLDEPTIVRNAVEAFVAYVEHYKESPPFPLEFRKPGVRIGDKLSPADIAASEKRRYAPSEVVHITPAKKAKAKQLGEGRG